MNKIRDTGLAIARSSWDFQDQERSKNNLRGITFGISSVWGIHSLNLML